MPKHKFHLYGVPPDAATQVVWFDPASTVGDIKYRLSVHYHLNPRLPLHLIYRGKVLPDNISYARLRIAPGATIGVMVLMAGG